MLVETTWRGRNTWYLYQFMAPEVDKRGMMLYDADVVGFGRECTIKFREATWGSTKRRTAQIASQVDHRTTYFTGIHP